MKNKKSRSPKSNANIEMSSDISPDSQKLRDGCASSGQQSSSSCKNSKNKK